jgi:hypothetical protein
MRFAPLLVGVVAITSLTGFGTTPKTFNQGYSDGYAVGYLQKRLSQRPQGRRSSLPTRRARSRRLPPPLALGPIQLDNTTIPPRRTGYRIEQARAGAFLPFKPIPPVSPPRLRQTLRMSAD